MWTTATSFKCSTNSASAQLFTGVYSQKCHIIWWNAAYWSLTLPVGSICGLQVATSCSYGIMTVQCLVVGPSLWLAPMAWNLLPDTLCAPTYSFNGFWRDLKTFLSLTAYTAHSRLCYHALSNSQLSLILTITSVYNTTQASDHWRND